MGSKSDLRDDTEEIAKLKAKGESPVSAMQGQEMKRKINAFAYIECSARSQNGIRSLYSTKR